MPIWRIRFSDKSGRVHAIYYQRELAPSPAEMEMAMQEHLLNLHSDKDAAPAKGLFLDPADMEELNLLTRPGNEVEIRPSTR